MKQESAAAAAAEETAHAVIGVGGGGQVVKAPNLNLIFALQYVLEVDGGGGGGGSGAGGGGEVNTGGVAWRQTAVGSVRGRNPESQEGTRKVNRRRSLSLRWAAHHLLLEDH